MDEKQETELLFWLTKRLTVRTNIKVQALEEMMAKSNPDLFEEYVIRTMQLEKESEAMNRANNDVKTWCLKNLGTEIPLD